MKTEERLAGLRDQASKLATEIAEMACELTFGPDNKLLSEAAGKVLSASGQLEKLRREVNALS